MSIGSDKNNYNPSSGMSNQEIKTSLISIYDKINKPYQFFDSMIYLKGYNKINRNTANIKKEKEQKMNSNE